MKLMHVERNLKVIEDKKWLLLYLKEFSTTNKSIEREQSCFWLDGVDSNHASVLQSNIALEELQAFPSDSNVPETPYTILDHLPLVQEKRYFWSKTWKTVKYNI